MAARYGRREELLGYAAQIEARGDVITSRWLRGNHQVTDDGLSGDAEGTVHERERFALEDMADLLAADMLIAFSEPPRSAFSRGGRHVEFGIALGVGLPVVVIGPRENVFHCLPGVQVFAAWDEMQWGFLADPQIE